MSANNQTTVFRPVSTYSGLLFVLITRAGQSFLYGQFAVCPYFNRLVSRREIRSLFFSFNARQVVTVAFSKQKIRRVKLVAVTPAFSTALTMKYSRVRHQTTSGNVFSTDAGASLSPRFRPASSFVASLAAADQRRRARW